MGSLGGPESPKPCSHKMKLGDAIDVELTADWEGEEEEDGGGEEMNIVKMVMQKVMARSATGFNANSNVGESFIFLVGSSMVFLGELAWFISKS